VRASFANFFLVIFLSCTSITIVVDVFSFVILFVVGMGIRGAWRRLVSL